MRFQAELLKACCFFQIPIPSVREPPRVHNLQAMDMDGRNLSLSAMSSSTPVRLGEHFKEWGLLEDCRCYHTEIWRLQAEELKPTQVFFCGLLCFAGKATLSASHLFILNWKVISVIYTLWMPPAWFLTQTVNLRSLMDPDHSSLNSQEMVACPWGKRKSLHYKRVFVGVCRPHGFVQPCPSLLPLPALSAASLTLLLFLSIPFPLASPWFSHCAHTIIQLSTSPSPRACCLWQGCLGTRNSASFLFLKQQINEMLLLGYIQEVSQEASPED